MLLRSPPALNSEELLKEEAKKKLYTLLNQSYECVEAAHLLINNQLLCDAEILSRRLLESIGQLALAIAGRPDRTGLDAIEPELGGIKEGPCAAPCARLLEIGRDLSLEGRRGKAALRTRVSRCEEVLRELDRISRGRIRLELRTSLDDYRIRAVRLQAIGAVLFLAAIGAAIVFRHEFYVYADRHMRDLRYVRDALERFKRDRGAYPSTELRELCQGRAGDDWIPGLAPQYLPALPGKPNGKRNCWGQYIYKSDGQEYKLVVFGADNFSRIKRIRPDLVDPSSARNMSYGFWSQGGAGL